MKKHLLFICLCSLYCLAAFSQNTGIGTDNPQAKLDVNGTFRLQHGVTVNEISIDTTFAQATDAILPTQLAVKKYLQSGMWVPGFQSADSTLVLRDSIGNQQTLTWAVGQDTFVYAIRAGSGLYIYDISDPDSIVLAGSTTVNMNNPARVAVQGNYAYVTSFGNNQLNIYDISNPGNIIPLGTTNQNLDGPRSLSVEGDYAYVTSYNNDRICIFNISNPTAITSESYVTHAFMDGPEMVWKAGNYIWVTSQFGSGTGYLHRYLVSNPAAPVLKGYTNENINKPHDVQTSGHHAFVTCELNNSIAVFDGSHPDFISNVSVFTQGLNKPNHMSICGRYAYVTSAVASGNIVQINITNPLHLVLRPQQLTGLSNTNAAVHAFGPYLCVAGAANHALWLFEWSELQEDRRISTGTDGSYSYDFGVWQTKKLLHAGSNGFGQAVYDMNALAKEGQRLVYREHGNVGIGTSKPKAKLHLSGNQKFYGGYYPDLEFGAGIPGKELNAGKIYYEHAFQPEGCCGNGQYFDVFTIVGGGSPGNRRIKFTTDEFINKGTLLTNDTLRFQSIASYSGVKFDRSIGINTDPQIIADQINCSPTSTPHYIPFIHNIRLNGTMRIYHDQADSGLYLDEDVGNHEKSAYVGMKDNHIFGFRRNDEWPFQVSTVSGHIGMFSAPHPVHRLVVNNRISVWGKMHVAGQTILNRASEFSQIAFGVGTANKHPQSGLFHTIYYDLYITGAGPDTLSRKIKFWAEGGLSVSNNLVVQGNVNATSITTPAWEDLTAFFQNGWSDYGNGFVEAGYYKDVYGVVHLRGLITGGLNEQNTVICTLPETHRPLYGHLTFAVVNGVNTLGRVDIETDGDVVFRGSNTGFLSLDQISFRTF